LAAGAGLALAAMGTLAVVQVGVWRHSLSLWRHTVRVSGGAPEMLSRHAAICIARGEYHLAIPHLTRVLRLLPESATSYARRGAAFGRLGQYEAALRDLTRAIELDPNFVLAYALRGTTYCAMGAYESGIRDFDLVLASCPEDAEARFNRGVAWLMLKQYDRAISDFTAATRAAPRELRYHQKLAWAYLEAGDHEAARAAERTCRDLGGEVDAAFLERLAKTGGLRN
jgi:tetratricopeptide (TPR) repeat protein